MWPFKKSKRYSQLSDRVWLTRAAKERGIVQEVAERAKAGVGVLVVCHFYDALASLSAAFDRAGLAYEQTARLWEAEDSARIIRESEHGVFVVPTSCLPTDSLGRGPSPVIGGSPELLVIVVERHPLRAKDCLVEDFVETLPCRTSLRSHLSFEDGLMRIFAREWVAMMMKTLGLTEDKCIESSMVTRGILRAQKKIEKRVIGDAVAESCVEWIALNTEPK